MHLTTYSAWDTRGAPDQQGEHPVHPGWTSGPWDLWWALRCGTAALPFNGKCHLQVPQFARGAVALPSSSVIIHRLNNEAITSARQGW